MKNFSSLLLVVMVLYGQAYAHDPGFSTAVLTLDGQRLSAVLVYAQSDIDSMTALGVNSKQEVFNHLAPSAIELKVSHKQGVLLQLLPLEAVSTMMSDTLQITLQFLLPVNYDHLQLTVALIKQLPRGHRQYVVVRDQVGQQISQHLLSEKITQFSLPYLTSSQSQLDIFIQYVVVGITHIWMGFDHLLFLLTLLLPTVLVYHQRHWHAIDKLQPAVIDTFKIITAFTLAHSITLTLATLQWVTLPIQLVESTIALSVVLVAMNNIRPVFNASRWLFAFVFGLIHGFGFANALQGLSLSTEALVVSLLGFNGGVELGQLVIVVLFFPAIALIRRTAIYRTWGLGVSSWAIAFIAGVWVIERTFGVEIFRF